MTYVKNTIMNCHVCMADDIENPTELLSCGNDGCTFKMCTSCTRSYYSRKYGYRKCPQCRSSPTGSVVRTFIPPVPVAPISVEVIVPRCECRHPHLACTYLALSALLAWFVGATITGILGHSQSDMGIAPGLYAVYVVILGYGWIACLIMFALVFRFICNRICAPIE